MAEIASGFNDREEQGEYTLKSHFDLRKIVKSSMRKAMVSTNDRDELVQNRHHLDADSFDTLDQFPATGQG